MKKVPNIFLEMHGLKSSYFVYKIVVLGLLILLIFSLNSFKNNKATKESPSMILVCGDSKVLLVDVTNSKDSIPKVVWSWDTHEATDLPPDYRTHKFNTIDDCKAINRGSQIMVSSSSGGIAIVNREDKKVTFYAEVPHSHSIALLPGNKMVAAASTGANGNRLMLFDITQPREALFIDSLYSAHGLVWDSRRKVLFALGYDVLREYRIQDDKLLRTNTWDIPGVGGHDLQATPGGNQLFMTEHNGAWIFDIETKRFSKIEDFPDTENIKSINQNQEGRFLYTVPEDSWWTYHVRFFNPDGILAFPDLKVYKARWYMPSK